jgi:tetratricopeptide (TPR) repeat protein
MPFLTSSRRPWLVGLLLFVGTVLLFSRSVGFGFVNYDDSGHVYNNPHVQAGLTGESLRWAFTGEGVIWNPLTRLSHLVDGQLYGKHAWGHHLSGILWHAANAVLVFLLLRRLTGAFWGAALCAALFAWHPLRVESVTWVSERKDVLSGFFFLLTLWCYTTYAERRRNHTPGAGRAYAATLLCFLCGLLSKPMLVTVPGVLLLLDAWPLRRAPLPAPLGASGLAPANPENSAVPPPASTWPALLLEKLPFVALAALFSVVAMHTQQANGAFVLELPLLDRLANAPVAVARYLGKFFWPFDLVVAYPHPGAWPATLVAGAVLLVLALTVLALRHWSRRPWLLVGWLWFLGTLVPVLGLVQIGFQSIADRYTYLPTLGVTLALVWTLRALSLAPATRIAGAGLLLLGCALRTVDQQGNWRTSVALYEHALACTTDNAPAHAFLGYTLFTANGDRATAELHTRRALALAPNNILALTTRAGLSWRQGRLAEAAADFRTLLALNPRDAEAAHSLSLVQRAQNLPADALATLRTAHALLPDNLDLQLTLADLEATLGHAEEAVRLGEEALRRQPSEAALHSRFSAILAQLGRTADAFAHAEQAVALAPAASEAHANLAHLLHLAGRVSEACAQYRQATALDPDNADHHLNLGVALAQNQDTEAALAEFATTLRLRPACAPAHTEIGHLLLARDQPAEAAERFRRALAIDPRLVRALLGLARAGVQLGAYDEAAASLQQAIELQPANPEPYSTWAEILVRQGRFAEAIPPYEKALGLQPEDAGAHAALGYALFLAGRRTDARREWEEALRLDPDFPKLRARLQTLSP